VKSVPELFIAGPAKVVMKCHISFEERVLGRNLTTGVYRMSLLKLEESDLIHHCRSKTLAKTLQEWEDEESPVHVVCATVAFGMG
jgi:hypothetical protein